MSIDLINLACEGVRTLKPYKTGKTPEMLAREYGVTDAIKLASNENPLGVSPKAADAIRQAAAQSHLYPDGDASTLKAALAEHLGVERDCLTIGNGSNAQRPGDNSDRPLGRASSWKLLAASTPRTIQKACPKLTQEGPRKLCRGASCRLA